MTQLYHQLGYRYKWSIHSLEDDNAGDGLIIAPRYIKLEHVLGLPIELRQRSFFDPQFFLPNSNRGSLSSYPFFPNVVANGFSSAEWNQEMATGSAVECLQFQVDCDFKYLIIPTRFVAGMPSNFIENQTNSFVSPFLEASSRLNSSKPLILQLILTDQMLKDDRFRSNILNWVTGINEISGVYLIYYNETRNKQIVDIDFLLATLSFIHALKQADMVVALGYLNTESIPLLAANPDIITMGSYENLRMFNIRAFEEAANNQTRGPNARIYVARLLQWIEYQYIGAISRIVDSIDNYIDDNHYRVSMFEPTYKWHFTKKEPYMHYFLSFSNQFRRLNAYNNGERLENLRQECQNALKAFNGLINKGLVVDRESSEIHLTSWITTLNLFERQI